MDRKTMAEETLQIIRQGYYVFAAESENSRIVIEDDIERSIKGSLLISPADGEVILQKYSGADKCGKPETRTENISTVEAIFNLSAEGKNDIGVLNFASAKNPGGGFLNGAKAQEETLTVSSTLYPTLTAHEEYYRKNRENKSMMYLDYGIYSPDTVFFRDKSFALAEKPVKASVLTLPAVNMGQVVLKGEDKVKAKKVMYRRMKLCLGIFAEQGAKNLVLGAYGCGVFRNEPTEIAAWWEELLENGMGKYFDSVFYAVLDNSKTQNCIKAFQKLV